MHKIEQLSDQQLMKEIMSDNFKAFTELYNRYKHTLFQFDIRPFARRLFEGRGSCAGDIYHYLGEPEEDCG